ncbi:Allophanate hydrolase subunit 1 [Kitasatospora sp. MMS16-BH015]|uniref:5-oxoprolinase subunit B family protein n=1 Tax=Kitasatospora sp. MMS16-BH015 TaxID=2018025 RepID=UPI000CA3D31A|nr:allophanate hydrolase subunit 1 [Kitasatospora sp. MMS16-BH015]AUG76472.1 Allophanate hydrolase subunit 1 [Kitasatospora sp. MMS16-BH015]
MRVLRCGVRAVLVELDDLDQVTRLHAALTDHPLPGVGELVPAARTLLLRYDPALTDHDRLGAALTALPLRDPERTAGGAVVVPVRYDGADLGDAARHTGLSVAELIARHTAPTYRVAFCGFAPGFAYLTGLDPVLRLPRRAAPRTRVPAGALAVAGEFTGVYPRESPGGWQLLGSTAAVLWDPTADPPSRLTPGTTVRFVDVAAPR